MNPKGTLGDIDDGVTKGLTGLPVTEERARELGHLIAASLELDGLKPLMELLLGIAPLWIESDGEKATENWITLDADLYSRYSAAIEAVKTLYTYSPEFKEQVEAYMLSLRPKFDDEHERELTDDNKVKRVASKQGRGKR